MTTIRSRCPRCGEVDIAPREILLYAPRVGRSVYQFTCPACLDPVEKRADPKIVSILVSAGVELATRETLLAKAMDDPAAGGPPDPMDALPSGPPFTLDDVVAFHFLLLDDRYIEAFMESQPS